MEANASNKRGGIVTTPWIPDPPMNDQEFWGAIQVVLLIAMMVILGWMVWLW